MVNQDHSKAAFGTRAVHIGQVPDTATGAVVPSLSLATTFKQEAVGKHQGYEYSRSGNPTRDSFEHAVASLESAKHGLAFASGSAVLATIMAMFKAHHEVISVADVYGGTFRYFTRVVEQKVHFLDLDAPDSESIQKILEPALNNNTGLVWLETPTNPTLRVVDIEAIVKIVKNYSKDIIVVVDNTFLTPYFQQPMKQGADMVVNSVSKYINGHSDVIMGVAAMNDDKLYEKLKFLQNALGAIPAPFDCYLANRGLKTLHLRMQRHGENALKVAQYLQKSKFVEAVHYPGLPDHPRIHVTKKQATGRGFGGMVTFCIKGGLKEADKFVSSCRVFTLAESLGAVESLCEVPSLMTHASVYPEMRKKLGISDNLIRLSVGVEDVDDLIEDIEQALEKS